MVEGTTDYEFGLTWLLGKVSKTNMEKIKNFDIESQRVTWTSFAILMFNQY